MDGRWFQQKHCLQGRQIHILITPWNTAILGTQVSQGDWRSMLLSPGTISVTISMAPVFMTPLGHDRVAEERGCNSINLIIKILLCWGHPLIRFTWNTNIFTFFAHSERSTHLCLPQTSLSLIFQSCSFRTVILSDQWFSDHLFNHWSKPMNQYLIAYLAISPSK